MKLLQFDPQKYNDLTDGYPVYLFTFDVLIGYIRPSKNSDRINFLPDSRFFPLTTEVLKELIEIMDSMRC